MNEKRTAPFPRIERHVTRRTLILSLALFALASGCAAGGGGSAGGTSGARAARRKTPHAALAAPAVDSATVLLWHLDETVGTRVVDAGPHALDGTAGLDTRTDLGRIQGARQFTNSVDSFIFTAPVPELETPRALTVEAWIRLDAIGTYEDTPIALRWNPRTTAESWIFSVGGKNLQPPIVNQPGPGDHNDLMSASYLGRATDRLLFAFMPRDAGAARVAVSNQTIDLNRWIHVAVTFDGKVVRFYVDGRLDSQVAANGDIRASDAPLLVGNAIDSRALNTFQGDLRVTPEYDHNPYYAFQGSIDELRISNVARTSFPNVH